MTDTDRITALLTELFGEKPKRWCLVSESEDGDWEKLWCVPRGEAPEEKRDGLLYMALYGPGWERIEE